MLWPYQWTESESVSCRLSDSRGLSSGERPPRIPGDQQGTLVGKRFVAVNTGSPQTPPTRRTERAWTGTGGPSSRAGMTKAAPHTLSDSEKASGRRTHAEQFKDKAENVRRRHMLAATVEKWGRTDTAARSVDVCGWGGCVQGPCVQHPCVQDPCVQDRGGTHRGFDGAGG